ncbi:MAG TPA: DUF4124 domain-containing protein [Polaromonas sp.]|uniref:DUF4124 domain-containing protein n=1 Tax=Polaromonas sp. TaxID=1869339 RepID=UPI002D712E7B|nr:DUF4124 domain-containing protein [Polaromonas sp.]HYW58141.1 DUF4124 domain-containing protein [Polaromonas sp.]
MRLFWTALVASSLCLPAFAQVYKWVDEKGVTQYGQRPPADNRGQKMDMPKSGPAAPAGDTPVKDARASLKEQELEFKKRQIARETAEQNDVKQAEARKNWCLNAKDDLERLRHARIYDLNAKGERVFKSDADRDASFAKYEANYKQNCQ